jgi:solute carrier family 10 (sodium/bile acid cotransporter), member 7
VSRPGGFLVTLFVALALGLVYPGPGADRGVLHMPAVTSFGISLIFFLHGAALALQNLAAGAKNWRLHLCTQLTTFALFPLLGLIVIALARPLVPLDLLTGFFFLCVLSSTISSSVALTVMAKGNVAGAVFNATLSGLLGMFLTPVLAGALAHTSGQELPLAKAIVDILIKLLLPFAAGQLLRPLLAPLLVKYRGWVTYVDRGVILLIVYASFSQSTEAGVWSGHGAGVIALVVAMTALLLVTAIALTVRLTRAFRLSREDEIATLFCGSTKSLANGVPIAKVLFANHPAIGMIVLPVMVYHPLQLVVCTWLARRYAARTRT